MIYIILLLAFGLRFISLSQSLWLDEAIGAIAARDFSYWEILTNFMKADNHSPLYYLMLRFWTGIFGFSEIAIRSMTVLIGVLTIYFTYKLIIELFDHKYNKAIAILTALFMATSHFHIYYSQEARMYAQTGLFAVMSFYFYIRTLQQSSNFPNWLGFFISITLLMFSDYVPVFILPVFWIYPLINRSNKLWWRNFILSHSFLGIFGLLWLPIFLVQLENGSFVLNKFPQWKTVAGGASIKNAILVWTKFTLGRINMINKNIYYSLIFVASLPIAYALKNTLKKKYSLYLLWLVFPLVFGYFASIFFPAFIYFRFVYLIPVFYLLISTGIISIKNQNIKKLLVASILFFNFFSVIYYIKEDSQKREDWKNAVLFIEQNAVENDLVIFSFSDAPAPYRWYSKGEVDYAGATNSISADREETILRTKELIGNRDVLYHFEYLEDLSDPNQYVRETISSEGFEIVEVYGQFKGGVGQIYKWQKKEKS